MSLEFATLLFQAWLTERDISAVGSALRKAQLEGKLLVRDYLVVCGALLHHYPVYLGTDASQQANVRTL